MLIDALETNLRAMLISLRLFVFHSERFCVISSMFESTEVIALSLPDAFSLLIIDAPEGRVKSDSFFDS